MVSLDVSNHRYQLTTEQFSMLIGLVSNEAEGSV